MFNMIGPLDGGRVLDLCAGSGGLYRSASRGMSSRSVERDRRAQEIVAANIAMTKAKRNGS